MTMATKNDLHGMLIIRLSDRDLNEQAVASQIRKKLSFVAETAQITELLINLEDVSFLSSEAIGQLIMLKKKCDQNEIALALCDISPKNIKVLRLVRCDEIIDVYETQQAAIEALKKTLVPIPEEPLTKQALANLHQGAESGDVDTILELARRMADGNGMEQDAEGAIRWFHKAAEQNNRDAQYELATCYAFGLGVPQDYGQAIGWYEKAARQGHADAQYMLGMSFHYGLNDIVDELQADKWYTLASVQGHTKARLALDELDGMDE